MGDVNEDLTLEERKMRWRILEAVRRERTAGRRVEFSNREIWIEGVKWSWNERDKGGMG